MTERKEPLTAWYLHEIAQAVAYMDDSKRQVFRQWLAEWLAG